MRPTPIPECYWVLPQQLLAGEYPRTWDDASAQAKVDFFIHAGVKAFIDLTREDDLLEPYAHLLHTHAPQDITYQHFRIQDQSVPKSVSETEHILDAIDDHLRHHRMVYVHCWGGIGRTGTIIGCWLSRHGSQGDAALRRLRELWAQCPKSEFCASPQTREQERYIIEWKEKHDLAETQ